jgi:hypothetical protein
MPDHPNPAPRPTWADLDHRWDCPCSRALRDLSPAGDRDDDMVSLISDAGRQDPRPLDERPNVRLVLPSGQMIGAWRVLATLLAHGQLFVASTDLTDHLVDEHDGGHGGEHWLWIGFPDEAARSVRRAADVR